MFVINSSYRCAGEADRLFSSGGSQGVVPSSTRNTHLIHQDVR